MRKIIILGSLVILLGGCAGSIFKSRNSDAQMFSRVSQEIGNKK